MITMTRAISSIVLPVTLCLTLGLAGSAGASEILVDEPEEVEGTEDCIYLPMLRRTEVLDDRNILFEMTGGKIYRNFLPRRCRTLSSRQSFMYESRASRLCRSDRIRIIDSMAMGTGMAGPSCGLGKFYPVTENEVKAMKEQIRVAKEAGITSPDPQ